MTIANDHKFCTGCGNDRPRSDFHRGATQRDGLAKHCRECSNRRHRLRQMGKTLPPTWLQLQDPRTVKKCYRCQNTQPRSHFSINRTKPDGLRDECCRCNRAIARAYHHRRKEAAK